MICDSGRDYKISLSSCGRCCSDHYAYVHLGHHQGKCRDGYEKHVDNETSIQWCVYSDLLGQSPGDDFAVGCRCYSIWVKFRLRLRLCLLTQYRILLLLNVVAVVLDVLSVATVGAVSLL